MDSRQKSHTGSPIFRGIENSAGSVFTGSKASPGSARPMQPRLNHRDDRTRYPGLDVVVASALGVSPDNSKPQNVRNDAAASCVPGTSAFHRFDAPRSLAPLVYVLPREPASISRETSTYKSSLEPGRRKSPRFRVLPEYERYIGRYFRTWISSRYL